MPDPQLRLRQQAMKDPGAAAARRGLARSFCHACGDQCQTKRQLLSVAGGKMVGGELQEALQQVTAGGDAGVRITCQPIAASQLKICCRLYPAGVAGHLRIVPAGAEQPTA